MLEQGKGTFERNVKELELNSKNKNNVEEYRGINKWNGMEKMITRYKV
jgi:hypothetical protein